MTLEAGASGPAGSGPAGKPAAVAGEAAPGLRVELKLSQLATPPTAAELTAISIALQRCWPTARAGHQLAPSKLRWRFAERWWLPAEGPVGQGWAPPTG